MSSGYIQMTQLPCNYLMSLINMSSIGVMCIMDTNIHTSLFPPQCSMIFLSHKPRWMLFNTWDQYWPEGSLDKGWDNFHNGGMASRVPDVQCFGRAMIGTLRSSQSSKTQVTLTASRNQWGFKTDKKTDSSAVGHLRGFCGRVNIWA